MAFTYNVTGTGSNKVLTITSPDEVTISVSGNNVVLSQAGSANQTVGALSEFGVGGLPSTTLWNGVATANVVADHLALGSQGFFDKYNLGNILESNATGLSQSEWDVLSLNLGKLADESLAKLTLTEATFDTVLGATQTLLDVKLSNVAGDIATINANSNATSATIVASEYDFASFVINGSTGADVIYGGAGNDSITGDSGADSIVGGAGNDSIIGGYSDDTITGGLGNDVITIGGGSDTITDLGAGSDVLVVTDSASAYAVVTTDWTATSATKNSSSGSVTLDLGDAVDVNLRAATSNGGYTINAAGNTAASIITGSTNADIITGSSLNDELRGAAGSDTISGGVGVDAIYGGAGANSLNGGAGVDTFTVNGSDVIADLGQGADVLVVTSTGNVTSAVVATSWTATSATQNEGVVNLDLNNAVNVDLRAAGGAMGYTIDALNNGNTAASNIVGSNFVDNITGSSLNDQIRGAQGNDTIDGSGGSDIIYGGAGADVFLVNSGTDTIADLGTGADVLVVGSGAGANTIVVSDWVATANTSNNGTMRATLDLVDGVDVNLNAALGSAGYTITADGNLQASVIAGATTADYITGSSLNDELRGYKGNDTIFGGSGDDAIYGGAGENSISGDAGSDTFNLNGSTDTVTDLGNGVDALVVTGAATVVTATVTTDWTATAATLNTSTGVVTLDLGNSVDVNLRAATGDHGYTITAVGNTAASIVTGSNFADAITGSSLADQLRGAQGNDVITGGSGNDVMYGGAGNDTFNVDAGVDSIKDFGFGADTLVVSNGATATATVQNDWTATSATTNAGTATLNLDNGIDVDLRLATVSGSVGYNVSASNNALSSNITGSNGNDTVNGSVTADELRGAQGADVINGNGGADNITGGAGADVLSGGEGADTFFYASGSTGVTTGTEDQINDFYSALDLISTGVTGLTSADVTIADGTAQATFDAFKTAAEVAFAAGKDVYVSYNQGNAGDALVAINNNGGVTFTSGDSLIKLVGVNQATEISASNFIA